MRELEGKMNGFLVLLMVAPGYLVMGGFTSQYVHRHPRHDRGKCDSGDRMPCVLWAGFGWPLIIAWLLPALFWKLGESLEDARPVHRRERREEMRKKDLRSLQ